MTKIVQRENPTCVYPTLIGLPMLSLYQTGIIKSRTEKGENDKATK
jgi:hypothetical protein